MARRAPDPIPRVHRAWRLPPRRNSEGLSKGFCVVLRRCLPAAGLASSTAIFARLFSRPENTGPVRGRSRSSLRLTAPQVVHAVWCFAVLDVDGQTVAESNAINRYVGTLTDLYPSGACRFACDEVMEAVRTSTRSLRPPFSFQRRKDGTAQRGSRRAAPVLSHAAKEAARSIWRPLLRCGLVVGRAESPDRERGGCCSEAS